MTEGLSLTGGQAVANILPLAQVPYSIVGVGEITNSLCGKWSKLLVCSADPSHRMTFPYVCHKWTCPTCFLKNVSRAAHRGEDRINAVRSAYKGSGFNLGDPVHVTFSPPESEHNQDLKLLKQKALKYAHQVGILGGSVIFHPYRILKHYDYELKQYLKQLPREERKGVWALVRADVLGLGSWTKYVYFSPHFHIVGYLPIVKQKSNEFYDATGWIYKNITANTGRLKSVCATLHYLLTHSFYQPNKQLLTYFGLASYNKIHVETIIEKEDCKCPKCSGVMWLHTGWTTDLSGEISDIGEPLYIYEKKKIFVKYKLKPPKLKDKY